MKDVGWIKELGNVNDLSASIITNSQQTLESVRYHASTFLNRHESYVSALHQIGANVHQSKFRSCGLSCMPSRPIAGQEVDTYYCPNCLMPISEMHISSNCDVGPLIVSAPCALPK